MKITRNGVEYELTFEECRKAYEEWQYEIRKEDLLCKLEEMEMENASEQQINIMLKRIEKSIDNNDYYWDIYWEVIENIIEEVMEVSYND